MAQESIELQPSPQRRDTRDVVDASVEHEPGLEDGPPEGRQEFSLPPVDTGKDAWLFLLACFVLEALVWGFPFAFGVFEDYYSTHAPFEGSSQIAVIGTCAMGIMYLDIPLFMALQRLYPKQTLYAPPVGLAIMSVALVASSFSQQTWHLIATQGVLFAIGGSICYCPCILYMDEWFVRRKGFAFGVMWSGTGLGGCTAPPLLQFLLTRYGFRTTLRVWACALFVLAMPLIYFIKPRLPAGSSSGARPLRLNFVLNRRFVLYQLANVFEAVGFFLPSIYLPTYARTALGAGAFPAAMTVLALNVAQVLGCVVMGTLVDRLEVTTCILISTVGAAVGTFLLWGLANNLAVLYLFCVVYGFFAGAYTSTWPGIMRQMMSTPTNRADAPPVSNHRSAGTTVTVDPVMVFGILAMGRGVGNVVAGPLSEALIKGRPWMGQAFAGYGSGYGPLIAFTGATAAAGGASYVWSRVGWM